jgi:hypothetical protein
MDAAWQEIAALVLTGLAVYYLAGRLRQATAKPPGGACASCGSCPVVGHGCTSADRWWKLPPRSRSKGSAQGDRTTNGYPDN